MGSTAMIHCSGAECEVLVMPSQDLEQTEECWIFCPDCVATLRLGHEFLVRDTGEGEILIQTVMDPGPPGFTGRLVTNDE